MIWRIWSFSSGLPVGALVALAALRDPDPLHLVWGALAGGVLLAAIAMLLARRGDDEFERGGHLAAATSFGWAAVPAAVAVFFDWSPGPWVYVALVGALLAGALFSATRGLGPAGGFWRWKLRAAASFSVASAGVLALAATGASFLGPRPESSSRLAATLFAIDAQVVTRPLPACSGGVRSVTTLLAQGANPSLSPDGSQLWFDAAVAADGGRRQIHRLDRATGDVSCTSCGQPGNNVHPSVSPSGVSIVFASDRHATWRHPDDTDLYLAAASRGSHADPGRRLSFTVGPDEAPVFGPGPMMVTWSRRSEGRYDVVAAGIRSGHGGLLLGRTGVIANGGAQWIAPLAWSPDARALLIARGNPYAALAIERVDPIDASRGLLATDGAPAGSFDGDGGWLAFATARPSHWAGVLPRALGFALGPIAHAQRDHTVLRRGSGVRAGATAQATETMALDLPDDVVGWGEPTGVALEPDGSGFVIGQRRGDADGVHDRLVAVELDCAQTAIAPRAVPKP